MLKKIVFISLLCCLMSLSIGCAEKEKKPIGVGYKDSMEHELLAQLMSKVIQKETPYKTILYKYGSTDLALEALKRKEIMVYADEAPGLGRKYLEQQPKDIESLMTNLNEVLAKDELKVLNHFGYKKSFIIAIREDNEELKNLQTMADLQGIGSDLHIATSMSFHDMEGGLDDMSNIYEYEFKTTQGYEGELRYTKVGNGDVEVVQGWSTDGYVDILKLNVLEDNLEFFNDANVIPVIHQSLEDDKGEVVEALKKLEGKITEKDIKLMQIKVIEDKMLPEEVALDFLREKNIIE